jgi:hypothetical protein
MLESALTLAPPRFLAKQRVGDVAQTAMPQAKSRTKPIRNFT